MSILLKSDEGVLLEFDLCFQELTIDIGGTGGIVVIDKKRAKKLRDLIDQFLRENNDE